MAATPIMDPKDEPQTARARERNRPGRGLLLGIDPILVRLGFEHYGQGRLYALPSHPAP